MAELADKYKLTSDSGVGLVLALNARLLALKPGVFDGFLHEFPHATILAWTGSGEPRIPGHLVDKVSDHFAAEGMQERIQFDCDIQQEECAKSRPSQDEKDSHETHFAWLGASFVAGIAIGVAIGKRL